ncbi:efflux RND transporter periplasmic adaptor subunit [Piscinibacter sakaiensis]|uniref:RND efflux system, membrane fusion protein CmeA n=1 Tax=Piscinibacter sakaiensis TaxID=1547922 RepID=A0A0K8NYQ4_PISS1|nr:efflux RND transporter periplasmic adaptor subunit [Piscinibacter sakaiensis]GAP35503.1 RND efflux system, membrane fusion protein CmeA [Piscinibacter sakaiensis]
MIAFRSGARRARRPGLASTSLALLAATVLLAACGKKEGAAAGGPPGGGMPPPEVSVVTVQAQTVGLTTELPGRLEASRVAQVRARAAGILRERLFREGSDVRAGQPLFAIDAAPYQAAVDSALATQAKAEAALAQATAQAERFKPLVEANAISKQDYVNAVAQQRSAAADVAAAKAAVQTQRINLGYTQVSAPIGGRIGRALVTEGALVGQGEATQLAVIQQINPMYVNFTQSTNEVLRLRKALAAGKLQRGSGDDAARVRVVLDDGSVYPQAGRLLFSDLTVDATSGQVTLRAEVPNPDGLLLPGMYVRVRLQQAEQPGGILLPQQAVTRSTTGDTVLVVGPDNKPAPRPIRIAQAQGTQWLVTDGLKPGEQVIVAGFQKMFVPGAPVKPVPWTPAASAASGTAPGTAAAASAPASAASRP